MTGRDFGSWKGSERDSTIQGPRVRLLRMVCLNPIGFLGGGGGGGGGGG